MTPAAPRLRVDVEVERDAHGVPAVRVTASVAGQLVQSFAVPPLTARAIGRLLEEKADEAGQTLVVPTGAGT